ncbi:MAG: hypothetical protein ACREO5_11330 [Candidatus Binatia bacterium]
MTVNELAAGDYAGISRRRATRAIFDGLFEKILADAAHAKRGTI